MTIKEPYLIEDKGVFYVYDDDDDDDVLHIQLIEMENKNTLEKNVPCI